MSQTLRLRVIPRFLASIFSGNGTTVRKDGLATYVDYDPSKFPLLVSYNPSVQQLLVQSKLDGSFGIVTISQVIAASQTEQDISSGSTVYVAATDGLIKINKTSGSATSVVLPAASTKVGPVKIVDWKGDADVNNITISLTGTDKLNGNQTTWTIAAQGGSIVAHPLQDGTGYAI